MTYFPTSEGVSEVSEQSGASERVSGASERANGRASGPVLQSVFLVVPAHCASVTCVNRSKIKSNREQKEEKEEDKYGVGDAR